ncbi:MAG TPA: AAA family ATPase [Candidatus Paceibacterota bacterium]|jgi:dephospho-CoA kinase|nr:AAA family ATPase [Candidatus Paceibacterota bacterium]
MIVAITGTNGAGKGTVVSYLIRQKGFAHYSVRDFLLEEIRARGLAEDRTTMQDVANGLRKEHGPAYILETLYARAIAEGKDAVIESVRAVAEADFLKKKGVYLLAVDASQRVRYERITSRGSSTDGSDFDTWVQEENRELDGIEPWKQNVRGVMRIADYCLRNDDTREELDAAIEAWLAHLA